MSAVLRSGCLAAALLMLAAGAASAQQICPGESVPIDTSVGSSPFVRMRLAGREGMFLIDTGANGSVVDKQTFGLTSDQFVRLGDASLPTMGEGNFRPLDLSGLAAPGGHPAGIIGTDVLASRVVELHYDAAQPFMVISRTPCPEQRLRDAGFVAVAQQGHYSAEPRRLTAAMAGLPVVFVRIGGVTAPAMIDSGMNFLDNSKHAVVNVNEALLRELQAAGVAMQKRETNPIVNCVGKSIPQVMWQVLDQPRMVTAENGSTISVSGNPLLRLQVANECVQIASEPYAILGALELLRWGAIVLDGRNDRVWISARRGALYPQPPYNALALAWDRGGKWGLGANADLGKATAAALADCNGAGGDCKLAASLKPARFACLALARNPRNEANLTYTVRDSLAMARAAAAAICGQHYAVQCKLELAICND